MVTTAERVGLEPTHGHSPPTAFPGRPLVQLGYLSEMAARDKWRRAGESNSQTDSRRPSAFEAGGLTTCPGPP